MALSIALFPRIKFLIASSLARLQWKLREILGRFVDLRQTTECAKADRRQFDDPRFRRELASWIHPSRSNDGMPAASQGLRALTDAATPLIAMAIRTFDLGNGVAAAHEELARGSPLLVALSTPMDNNEGWLAAGLGRSGCS